MMLTFDADAFSGYKAAVEKQFHIQMRTRAFGSNGM